MSLHCRPLSSSSLVSSRPPRVGLPMRGAEQRRLQRPCRRCEWRAAGLLRRREPVSHLLSGRADQGGPSELSGWSTTCMLRPARVPRHAAAATRGGCACGAATVFAMVRACCCWRVPAICPSAWQQQRGLHRRGGPASGGLLRCPAGCADKGKPFEYCCPFRHRLHTPSVYDGSAAAAAACQPGQRPPARRPSDAAASRPCWSRQSRRRGAAAATPPTAARAARSSPQTPAMTTPEPHA